jgi:hypothetical protein
MSNRSMFICRSFIDYIQDILYFRKDQISWKTAEFCKRNVNATRTTYNHIKYEIKHMVASFRAFKEDVRFNIGMRKKKISNKYSKTDV